MMRLHLFELMDLPRFPRSLRNQMTEYLRTAEEIGGRGLAGLVADHVAEALRRTGQRDVVDLCSGSGGILPAVVRLLRERGTPVRVTLTDLFPHPEALAGLDPALRECVSYHTDRVDATSVPAELRGARTMFAGLHHFRPERAREILADAARRGESILVFEATERRLVAIAAFLLSTPWVILLLTPFVRPFRWSRLALTYVAPVLPVCILWDGLVSHLRTYTGDELLAMTSDLAAGYRWEARRERVPGTPVFLLSFVGCAPPAVAGAGCVSRGEAVAATP